jgi:hypothetical protein
MNITLEKSPKLDRGERLIMVDGVAWGKTIVRGRGVHGTETTFQQLFGEVIGDVSPRGHFREITVRSIKQRRYLGAEDKHRPTIEMTLEKAKELIEAGRLRHPDVQQAEVAELREKIAKRQTEREREENEEFERRAREALRINDNEPSEIVERVVKAMRWAQQQ